MGTFVAEFFKSARLIGFDIFRSQRVTPSNPSPKFEFHVSFLEQCQKKINFDDVAAF